MALTFRFDLSQQQFELGCDRGRRRLMSADLLVLIEKCEQQYYSGRPRNYWQEPYDLPAAMVALGRRLYSWLDGDEGWLRAVQAAVQAMIAAKCSDWHLLRVYRDSRSLAELVTPMRANGRERLVRIQPEQDFLDAQDQVKVAGAQGFVGRRRSLQRCLKVIGPTSDRVGGLFRVWAGWARVRWRRGCVSGCRRCGLGLLLPFPAREGAGG